MTYFDFDPNSESPPLPEPEEPTSGRFYGCRVIVSLIIILSLIGSSVAGLIWLFILNETEPVTPTAVPVPTKSTPQTGSSAQLPVEQTATALPTTSAEGLTLEPTDPVNRIAFINGDGQLVTIAPDGRQQTVLTEGDEFYRFPAWSPDGQQIAAIGSSTLGSSVFVLNDTPRPGEPERLYFGNRKAPFYLYWSPNSQMISFLANDPEGMALHVAEADGSTDSYLRTKGRPLYWHWTADSQQILIHSGFAGEGARLEVLDVVAEGNGEQIAEPGFFQTPGISDDGRFWVYATELTGLNSQVMIVDTVTGDNQTHQHAGQVAMSLSPTSHTLAYISPDSPDALDFIGPLRTINADTGETQLLSREAVAAFFWSPDGRYIAAFIPNQSRNTDINAAAPNMKMGQQVNKPQQQTTLPTLKLVIFDVNTGEGSLLLSFTPTLSFLTQFVPFFDQYALSHRIWSPDSSAIVLPILEDGRSNIYIISMDSGRAQFLAEGSMAFWSQQ